jgi:hypothetical protein
MKKSADVSVVFSFFHRKSETKALKYFFLFPKKSKMKVAESLLLFPKKPIYYFVKNIRRVNSSQFGLTRFLQENKSGCKSICLQPPRLIS